MKGRLLLVCVLIALGVSLCLSPPDLISQLIYGLISGSVCAVSVWISQKLLLKLAKGGWVIVPVSILGAILVPCATHFVVYLMSMQT
jgi:lipopolysaccharide export LptBFGC system permease protein LptF